LGGDWPTSPVGLETAWPEALAGKLGRATHRRQVGQFAP